MLSLSGFFTSQIQKEEIPIRSSLSSYKARAPSRQELDDIESRLSEHESRLVQLNKSYETLQRRYWELIELKHVLREATAFFEEVKKLFA
jgi:V-type H+-transporting ATPase subunit a